jgi:hypothetical protein
VGAPGAVPVTAPGRSRIDVLLGFIPLTCLGLATLFSWSCAHPVPSPNAIHEAVVRVAPSTGELLGMAVDSATGEPLSHALVIANRIDGPTDSDRVAADYFGVFRMRPLPAGLYQIKVLYIGYSPRILDVRLPLPSNTILLAALWPRQCRQYVDLIVCSPARDTQNTRAQHDAEMSKAKRILEWWHGDAIWIALDGSIPNEDSVVAGIRDSLGGDAAKVLIEIVRERDSIGLNAIAATVYARLGLPSGPLQDILNSSDLRDEGSAAIASAAFRGLREHGDALSECRPGRLRASRRGLDRERFCTQGPWTRA